MEGVVMVQAAGGVVAQLFQARHVDVALRQDEKIYADLRAGKQRQDMNLATEHHAS